jgi:hypothetical protein
MVTRLKRQPTEWEKNLYIWEGTNDQNIQGPLKLNFQNINEPMKKWANEFNRAFSREKVKMTKNT